MHGIWRPHLYADRAAMEWAMADIVRIKERIARRPARMTPKEGDADVLLFTGVRYQSRAEGREAAATADRPLPSDTAEPAQCGQEPPA